MGPQDDYSVLKGPYFVRILSHMSPVHTFITRFFMINFNIILQSMSKIRKWSPLAGFATKFLSISHIFYARY
jgi:hypothetical protein